MGWLKQNKFDQKAFELVGQEKVREMIDGERVFVAVLAESSFLVPNAGVVHQHAERVETGLHLVGEATDVREGREVGLEGHDVAAANREALRRAREALGVATDDGDSVEVRNEAASRF